MARPKIEESIKYSICKPIKFRTDQVSELQKQANKLGVSFSEIVRALAFDKKVKLKTGNYMASTDKESVVHLIKIGNNLNQTQHAMNLANKLISQSIINPHQYENEINKLIAKLRENIKELSGLRKTILK